MRVLKFFTASRREYKEIFVPSLFLWVLMAGLAIGRAANDTFFIGQSGAENLPRVFIFNAIVLSIIALIYSFIEKRLPRSSLLIWLLIFFVILLSLLRTQLHSELWWLPYAVFCYYEVLLLIMQMHFWTCLNDMFGPREGKRFFPIIGAVGLCGTIFGGLFTWLASPLIGYHNLFFVWIFLLLCVIPIAFRMKRTAEKMGTKPITGKQGQLENLKEICRSPLVRYLALMSIPLCLIVNTVDWLFYLAVEEMFAEEPDRLSSFLGLLGGLVSFVGIILQLFITGPLLRKVGVGLSYSLYSFGMGLGALLFFIRGFLPVGASLSVNLRAIFPIMSRILDESILFSIYDSALQLLYGALPTAIRGQARALVYGVMETSMTGVSGLILSVVAAFAVPQQWIALTAFIFALLWILLSFRVRKYYLRSLSLNLNSQDMNMHGNALAQLHKVRMTKESSETLLRSVYSDDEDTALLALLYIKSLKDQKSLVELGKNVARCKGLVFDMALQLIYEARVMEALTPLKRIYLEEEEKRRGAALACIGQLDPSYIQNNADYFLSSSSQEIRAASILTILKTQKRVGEKNPALLALKELVSSPKEEVQLKGVKVLSEVDKKIFNPLLIDLTKSSYPSVRREVIKAMGHYNNPEIIHFLISEMRDVKSAHLLNNSIVQQGKYCIHTLHKEIRNLKKDNIKNFGIIRNIAYCLGEIGESKSIAPLGALLGPRNEYLEKSVIQSLANIAYKNKVELPKEDAKEKKDKLSFSKSLKTKIEKRLSYNIELIDKVEKYIYSLVYIENKKIKLILKDALERCRQQCLYLSLRCLDILGDPMKVRAAEKALYSKDSRERSEAIEVLEGLGEEGKRLSRMVERPQYRRSSGTIRQPDKLFKEMNKIKNYPWLRVCISHAIGELDLKSLAGIVKSLLATPDKLVQNSAELCLAKLLASEAKSKKSKKREDMSMDMERILFLRSVPIFSDVGASDLQWISEIIAEKEVKAGEYVFRENESGDVFYIVKEGEVQIHKGNVLLGTIEKREYFGEVAIFDREPRTADALVKKKSHLLSIHRGDFQRLLFAKPEIALAMFKTISHRLREVTKKIAT